ncbi:MAG: beta galactosidase jelly roll domain-containing protein [Bacteroidota bacterium]
MRKIGKVIFVLFVQTVLLVSPSFGQYEDWDRIKSLTGQWKFSIGDNPEWATKNFRDDGWESIYVPSAWENEGFYGYDGYAWYRRSFNGAELRGKGDVYLMLGNIDDADEVYVNGNLVGFSGGFPPKYHTAYKALRIYYVPSVFIDPNDKNTIAVKVYDSHGEGGIFSGPIGFYRPSDFVYMEYELQGIWELKLSRGKPLPEEAFEENNGEWLRIMVPAIWKSVGYWDYEGFGIYRKAFRYSGDTDDKYLVMGRIDDFDEVYLNGEFLGRTKDWKPLGQSGSYRKLRIYKIPDGLLKKKGNNTLTVIVENIGHHGGIHQGPVGIIDESKVNSVKLYGDNYWKK